jgi:hypothetical protein
MFDDRALLKMIEAASREVLLQFDEEPVKGARWLVRGQLDLNDWRLVKQNSVGIGYMPLTTLDHARTGARERVVETARRFPQRLRIELNALATRLLWDGGRVTGIE